MEIQWRAFAFSQENAGIVLKNLTKKILFELFMCCIYVKNKSFLNNRFLLCTVRATVFLFVFPVKVINVTSLHILRQDIKQ